MPKLNIDQYKFYTIGIWCFGIIAIMNTVGFFTRLLNHAFLLPTDAISTGVSLVFNYALFGFFSYLRNNLPPKDLEKGTLKDMEAVLNEK